jgi:hypothetical protein
MTAPKSSSQPTEKLGRNDPCHCGSGLKYKKCHAAQDDAARSAELTAQAAERAARAQAEREQAEADGQTAPEEKVGKAVTRNPAATGERMQRPKLPTPHNNNLPRRGAV